MLITTTGHGTTCVFKRMQTPKLIALKCLCLMKENEGSDYGKVTRKEKYIHVYESIIRVCIALQFSHLQSDCKFICNNTRLFSQITLVLKWSLFEDKFVVEDKKYARLFLQFTRLDGNDDVNELRIHMKYQ